MLINQCMLLNEFQVLFQFTSLLLSLLVSALHVTRTAFNICTLLLSFSYLSILCSSLSFYPRVSLEFWSFSVTLVLFAIPSFRFMTLSFSWNFLAHAAVPSIFLSLFYAYLCLSCLDLLLVCRHLNVFTCMTSLYSKVHAHDSLPTIFAALSPRCIFMH
jgi:hypothetical protein